jgi:transglutaminase-like putative cysteine protease
MIPQLTIDYHDTIGMGTGKMARARFGRLSAIVITAAVLAPAAPHAQAPKAPAPGPAKSAKAPAVKPSPAKAAKASKPTPDPAPREEPVTYTVGFDKTVTLRADRTAESVSTTRIKILGESALRSVGQQTISYVEGMQTLEVVDAYTEKADGRRIPVDPASIMTRDEASGLNSIYLRDAKTRIVIFPDLAVGDSIVLSTRSDIRGSVFPGQYFYNVVFPRQLPFADSTLQFVAPKDLTLNVAVFGQGIEDRIVEEGGAIRHVISYRGSPRLADEPGATSPLERDARAFISTFKDYEELGRAYWEEASKRATVTPEIQALADEITTGITDRRAQAAAIDHWVKANVRYVAIYLGSGRVVPNGAGTVLKNKYGDCKDQVTLMTALLAAKGIASELVLINGGNVHTLDLPATLAALNHVMIYLPEFGLYDDPTASFASFGVLSETYDKPAVHLSASGVRLGRTPAMRATDHTLVTQTKVTIAANGTVSGETKQSATGMFASIARAVASAVESKGPETVAEHQLKAFGTPGKGRYQLESPRNLAEPYVVRGRFTLNDRFAAPPAGRKVIPIGMPILGRPGDLLLGTRHQGRKLPFECLAGRQIEQIDVTLPGDKPLNITIPSRKIANRLFSYKSEYHVEGHVLKIRHEFVSLVPNQVCGPEIEADIAKPMAEVQASVNSRLAINSVPRPAAPKPPETGLGALFRGIR